MEYIKEIPDNIRVNLINKRFGKILVIGFSGQKQYRTNKSTMWACRCDCGNEWAVQHGNLQAGLVKQCKKCAEVSHRGRPQKYKLSEIKTVNAWYTVKKDCCPEWKNFEQFLKDVGYKPEGPLVQGIKIRKEEPYSPTNFRWLTLEQKLEEKVTKVIICLGKDPTDEELRNKYRSVSRQRREQLINKYAYLVKYKELQQKYKELQQKYKELQQKYKELQQKYKEATR